MNHRTVDDHRPPLKINSAIQGVTWPGIPAANGAAVLAILFQLEQTQWWAPDQVLEHQREQLEALLNHARAHVPFYRERMKDMGSLSAKESWLEIWRTIRPLQREDIQTADPNEDLLTEEL